MFLVLPNWLKRLKTTFICLESDPDYIPVVVLKNCEPEFSHILAELFNRCLKESCFPYCRKVSSGISVFKNVEERSSAKNYHSASILSAITEVFDKLVNNRLVDHFENWGIISDFQYGFRSSWWTADFLTVVSERIASAFNRCGATRHVALDRVWQTGLFHKHDTYKSSSHTQVLWNSSSDI